MRKLLSAGIVAASIAFGGGIAQALTFNEIGDAGQLLNSAQDVGASFDKITGTISSYTDVDLYKVYLGNGLFSATTDGSNFDTELYLFDSAGKGIVFNDDKPGTITSTSNITANITAGYYYIGVTVWDNAPVSSSGMIFPYNGNPSSNNNVYNVLNSPTGPGGGNSLTGWVNNYREQNGGNYQITLSQITTQSVPEPGATAGLALLGGVGFLGGVRRRLAAKNN